MKREKKRNNWKENIFCIVILLFIGSFLSANEVDIATIQETITLQISNSESDIAYYRYQLNGEQLSKWILCSAEKPFITYDKSLLENSILYVQQSYNGKNWSASSQFKYDKTNNVLVRLDEIERNVSTRIKNNEQIHFDTELTISIPFGIYSEYYKIGFGGKFHLNKTSPSGIVAGALVGYNYGLSLTSRVDQFHELSLLATTGYELITNDYITIIPELGIGVFFHMPVGTVSAEGEDELHYFTDFTAEAGLKMRIHLGELLDFYIIPRLMLFSEFEAMGIVGEVSIGTTVAL